MQSPRKPCVPRQRISGRCFLFSGLFFLFFFRFRCRTSSGAKVSSGEVIQSIEAFPSLMRPSWGPAGAQGGGVPAAGSPAAASVNTGHRPGRSARALVRIKTQDEGPAQLRVPVGSVSFPKLVNMLISKGTGRPSRNLQLVLNFKDQSCIHARARTHTGPRCPSALPSSNTIQHKATPKLMKVRLAARGRLRRRGALWL